MTSRSEFVKDIYYNGKSQTWDYYADKYNFRDGKQANDYYRWFIKNGSKEHEWEPGLINVEEKVEVPIEEVNDYSNIYRSREYQEFLAWKSEQEEKRTYVPGTYAIMGCTHVPFHNKKFYNACLNLFSDINPYGLILAGDYMDINSLSAHDVGKKPIEGVSLDWEYEQGNIALDLLDSCNDWKIKHYLNGNHEYRHVTHMSKADNAKYGGALLSPQKALELDERGYIVQLDWKQGVVYLGKHLEIFHGENCSIHAAKATMDKLRTSVMFFHTHRFQAYMEGNTASWNMGWGGDINSSAFNYATKAMKSSWKNAMAIVHIDEQGGYHVVPIVWHNDHFYYGSKKYS